MGKFDASTTTTRTKPTRIMARFTFIELFGFLFFFKNWQMHGHFVLSFCLRAFSIVPVFLVAFLRNINKYSHLNY